MSKLQGDPGYRAGWCIHFQSMGHHKECEAGVPYATFAPGRQPCFMEKDGTPKPDKDTCIGMRPPMPEEIAAHKVWQDARMEMFGRVMTGIRPWRDANRGRSHAEIIECPACKGRLHLSIAGSNGHVHGRCETAGCVSWME